MSVQVTARAYVGRRESFAFETTLSGRLYARNVRQWQEVGYRTKLIFLSLPDVEIAVERVRIRVAQGGHDVEESVKVTDPVSFIREEKE